MLPIGCDHFIFVQLFMGPIMPFFMLLEIFIVLSIKSLEVTDWLLTSPLYS